MLQSLQLATSYSIGRAHLLSTPINLCSHCTHSFIHTKTNTMKKYSETLILIVLFLPEAIALVWLICLITG